MLINSSQSTTTIVEIRCRANLWLQILLYLNVYFSLKWAKLYVFQLVYNHSSLYDLHGAFTLATFILALIMEYWRLHSGYSGNLRGRSSDLSTLLVISPLMQVPLLLLLWFMSKTHTTLIAWSTGIILALILFEIIVGCWAWRNLLQQQTVLFKLKQQLILQKQIQ